MKILCLGDIVGNPGRQAVEKLLPALKEEYSLDLVLVNAENAAGGSGLTSRIAKSLFNMGCDVISLGDHVWDQKELEEYLKESDKVVRPANFPEDVPGKGWCIVKTSAGKKVGVINILGRVFMRYSLNCPFRTVEALVAEVKKETNIVLVDIHAEATSEKVAMGHFVDGTVSAVLGTHTHIQTADETILPKGTAYITDLGMVGPYDSVIGQNKEIIIERFLKCMPIKFQVAENNVKLCGVVVDIDDETGLAKSIVRIQRPLL